MKADGIELETGDVIYFEDKDAPHVRNAKAGEVLLVEEVDSTGQVVVEESEVKTYVEYLGRLPCKG